MDSDEKNNTQVDSQQEDYQESVQEGNQETDDDRRAGESDGDEECYESLTECDCSSSGSNDCYNCCSQTALYYRSRCWCM